MGAQEDVWGWLHPALEELQSAADQPWDELRVRFLEQLGLTDPDTQPAVAALLYWLDELPNEERTATLASDQLATTAYELVQTYTPEPDAPGYDEQAWHTFLTTNGPTWDGTAESWPAFREWFEYHAAEQSLAAPATALFEFLEAQSATERVATLASYGVTIATTVAEPNFDGVSAEQAAELAEITQLINSIPSEDELTAELAGVPEEEPVEEEEDSNV